MPRCPLGGAHDILFKRRSGRADIAEVPVQHPGLAPQLGKVGCQHQHRLDHHQCPLVLLGLQQAGLEVILQAQQHVAVRHGS